MVMTVLGTITDEELEKLRPEVFENWTRLAGAIRSRMRLRRYELVTFASALALKCHY
jgi:hypothetical protein